METTAYSKSEGKKFDISSEDEYIPDYYSSSGTDSDHDENTANQSVASVSFIQPIPQQNKLFVYIYSYLLYLLVYLFIYLYKIIS